MHAHHSSGLCRVFLKQYNNTGWGISMVVYKTNVNATYWSLPSFSRWCFSVCSLSTNTSSSNMVGLIPLSILSFANSFLKLFSEKPVPFLNGSFIEWFLECRSGSFRQVLSSFVPQFSPWRRLKLCLEGVYDQKLLTEHQIMVLCPFHVRISGDKEMTGPVKFFY